MDQARFVLFLLLIGCLLFTLGADCQRPGHEPFCDTQMDLAEFDIEDVVLGVSPLLPDENSEISGTVTFQLGTRCHVETIEICGVRLVDRATEEVLVELNVSMSEEFDGVLPWARRGELSLSYSAEARTRGTLLPADEPGQRPTIWQLTSNSLAHVVRLALGAPLGREWRLAPAVSFSRRREYRPTQARWNPFRLGVELDKQEALEVEAGLTYRPTHGALGGNDVLSISVSRVYRRRTTFSDRRSYLSMAYQHMF